MTNNLSEEIKKCRQVKTDLICPTCLEKVAYYENKRGEILFACSRCDLVGVTFKKIETDSN